LAIVGRANTKTMKDRSVSIEAIDVLAPFQITSDRQQLYVVVPQDVTLVEDLQVLRDRISFHGDGDVAVLGHHVDVEPLVGQDIGVV
jgi:hypothetical protein